MTFNLLPKAGPNGEPFQPESAVMKAHPLLEREWEKVCVCVCACMRAHVCVARENGVRASLKSHTLSAASSHIMFARKQLE